MQFRSHELMTMRDAYPTSSGLGSDNVSHMIHGESPLSVLYTILIPMGQ